MGILVNWLVSGFAIFATAYILPGVHVDGFIAALITAVVLGLVNAFVRPILVLLTLPINILSLGLFLFVINAFMVWLAAQIVPGFRVDGFGWALLFSLVLTLVSGVLHSVVK